jgi:hypothetical protein
MNKILVILPLTALSACSRAPDPITSQRGEEVGTAYSRKSHDDWQNTPQRYLGQFNQLRSEAKKCLLNAKQVGLGCKRYAQDHSGAFPNDLNELIPDYLPDRSVFSSPLAPTPGQLDYEYFGAGSKDTDPATKVLLRGRYTIEEGQRSVVRYDISASLVCTDRPRGYHFLDAPGPGYREQRVRASNK